MMPTKITKTDSLTIDGRQEPLFPKAILPVWSAMTDRKGFSITVRFADRFHLALRCDTCGGLTKTKLFVLMNANPACAPCLEAKQAATAKAAG